MSKTIKIKKGLDIKLKGKAIEKLANMPIPTHFAVKPSDFQGLTPKLAVKPEDSVEIGTPLFYDKNHPEIAVTSPVSGKILSINRGERRRILEIVIESDGKFKSLEFGVSNSESITKDDLIQLLLKSGLWLLFKQRPFGVIAKPTDTPRDIFITGFDSSPLAPSSNFVLSGEVKYLQQAITALQKLTTGKIYLGIRKDSILSDIKGVETVVFEGPHPAGNVGVQIHHTKPINKGEKIWTIDAQSVVFIGRLLIEGKLNFEKIIALTGSELKQPCYLKTVSCAQVSTYVNGQTLAKSSERVISGNVLTGENIGTNGYLGYFHNQITVIPEGNEIKPLGWAAPGFDTYSASNTYFSKLLPKKDYTIDANLNGGERAFVVSEQYEKVFPMDILPVFLLKSIIINDIDKMEQLGIYEVIEEDMALCEYVCTSKIEVQDLLRKGINTMIKELG